MTYTPNAHPCGVRVVGVHLTAVDVWIPCELLGNDNWTGGSCPNLCSWASNFRLGFCEKVALRHGKWMSGCLLLYRVVFNNTLLNKLEQKRERIRMQLQCNHYAHLCKHICPWFLEHQLQLYCSYHLMTITQKKTDTSFILISNMCVVITIVAKFV